MTLVNDTNTNLESLAAVEKVLRAPTVRWQDPDTDTDWVSVD